MANIQTIRTFCRICEPSCGLIAEVADNTIQELKPDSEHPVSKGFACHKGLAFMEIHKDPDRLNQPQIRDEQAELQTVSWPEAITKISHKIRQLKLTHGPSSLASYIGNPLAHNSTAGPAISSFLINNGIRKNFSSGTQDCANKFAASEAVFGSSTIHPIPDIAHTEFLLILGSNPRISHMSFISIADPMKALRTAKKRGARIVFIDPRENESISGIGELLQIKPDTDVYLLAAMLEHLFSENLIDSEVTSHHAENLNRLEQFVANFPASRVAPVIGITAPEIRQLSIDFAAADKAAIYMSTGVNMGRQGTLAYWLLQMLSLLTGNLDKQGGNLYSMGFYPAAKAGSTRGRAPAFRPSPFGEVRTLRGSLPGNLLADMILDDPDPIRGLIVISGNPLLSMGNTNRLRQAFTQLEFVLVIDIYPNTTSQYADVILPATDMLERDDINLAGLGLQSQPYVQYTKAVVRPAEARKKESEIMMLLEQALTDEPDDLPRPPTDPFAKINHMLAHAGTSTAELSAQQCPVKILDTPKLGRFYNDIIQTTSGQVNCCPTEFTSAITRCLDLFNELENEPDGQLKLITRRTNYMMNSWYHNVASLKPSHQQDNPLYLNPADARARNLGEGSDVLIKNRYGEITSTIAIDSNLRPGTAAMTHGWGYHGSKMTVAGQYPGTNINLLLPSGPGSYEPLSNQSFMTGIPIIVEATS
jgi:anaerobic selenocysteine-containing dehydrogenase